MTNTKNGSNQGMVPEARAAMDRFKMEAAAEVGVNLKQGYNGDLTSRQAGSVGGQMVKKMIESYEQNMATRAKRLSFPRKKGHRIIPCPFTYAFSACLRNSSSSVLPLLSFHSVQPFALAPKTKQAAALGEENDIDLLR